MFCCTRKISAARGTGIQINGAPAAEILRVRGRSRKCRSMEIGFCKFLVKKAEVFFKRRLSPGYPVTSLGNETALLLVCLSPVLVTSKDVSLSREPLHKKAGKTSERRTFPGSRHKRGERWSKLQWNVFKEPRLN